RRSSGAYAPSGCRIATRSCLLLVVGGPQPVGRTGVAVADGEQRPEAVKLGLLAAALTALQRGQQDREDREQQWDELGAVHSASATGTMRHGLCSAVSNPAGMPRWW